MKKVSVAEAKQLCQTGLYLIRFRPNGDLNIETEFCLVQKLEDIYDFNADK